MTALFTRGAPTPRRYRKGQQGEGQEGEAAGGGALPLETRKPTKLLRGTRGRGRGKADGCAAPGPEMVPTFTHIKASRGRLAERRQEEQWGLAGSVSAQSHHLPGCRGSSGGRADRRGDILTWGRGNRPRLRPRPRQPFTFIGSAR